jgi:NAD(P)-dependent dehydrogenase (short-subunit alcohol dehydrogenase family)
MPTERADELRFDGRVAIVTGAGNGLGREYALSFAARGAAVVVNDIGLELEGSATSARPAAAVVEEIEAAGGRAVASFDDVTKSHGGKAMVDTAIDAFGRVDILVNNAGVLDTAEFLALTDAAIDRVIGTHLIGAFNVTRPALKAMIQNGYGRVVSTSSGAVFGNKDGVAYQAAKSGLIAFTRAVAQVGAPHGISSNAILPTAFTRMTSSIPDVGFRNFMETRFTPGRVAAGLLLLAHEKFEVSGECFLVGGGRMARLFLGVTEGYVTDGPSPEDYLEHLDQIMSTEGFQVPENRLAEFESYLPKLGFGASISGGLVMAETKESE